MDNDVLQKTIAYGLFNSILTTIRVRHEVYGVLGTAKYVVSKKLKKNPPSRGLDAVLVDFNAALQDLREIEPTPEEVEAAAYLEYQAQRLDLELDTGESILCAVLLERQLNHILTGDKRAIGAVEALSAAENISNDIASRLICLEQLFFWLVSAHDVHHVRTAVCSERVVDRVLTSCFSCYSPEIPNESCIEGLKSYIVDLRQTAPTVLAKDD
jgi:hypothetical protein